MAPQKHKRFARIASSCVFITYDKYIFTNIHIFSYWQANPEFVLTHLEDLNLSVKANQAGGHKPPYNTPSPVHLGTGTASSPEVSLVLESIEIEISPLQLFCSDQNIVENVLNVLFEMSFTVRFDSTF